MTDVDYVQQKIQGITDDLALLAEFDKDAVEDIFSDPIRHHAFNNIMQQIIQRAVDINHHLIADKDPQLLQSPVTYRQTFEMMGQLGVLPEGLARDVAGSAGLRNVLVHEYDNVDPKRIDEDRKAVRSLYPRYCEAIIEHIK